MGADGRLAIHCGADEVFAVDVRLPEGVDATRFSAADLSVAPIPYPDAYFDSVSAFDFLEHVPRVLVAPDGRSTTLPFVRLMNEVWRVLVPGGRFYAVTPAVPSLEAFSDPTHVNYVTEHTHHYFCGEQPGGRAYGFIGRFELAVKFLIFGAFSELFAKETGFNRGMGGSMHAFFTPFGSYPNNAVVGGSGSIAPGAALFSG